MVFASSIIIQRRKKMTITQKSRNSQSAESQGHPQHPVSAAESAEAHMSV